MRIYLLNIIKGMGIGMAKVVCFSFIGKLLSSSLGYNNELAYIILLSLFLTGVSFALKYILLKDNEEEAWEYEGKNPLVKGVFTGLGMGIYELLFIQAQLVGLGAPTGVLNLSLIKQIIKTFVYIALAIGLWKDLNVKIKKRQTLVLFLLELAFMVFVNLENIYYIGPGVANSFWLLLGLISLFYIFQLRAGSNHNKG